MSRNCFPEKLEHYLWDQFSRQEASGTGGLSSGVHRQVREAASVDAASVEAFKMREREGIKNMEV